ncbi:Uncharacterized protein Adt_39050 [Abeliophyllum distichum]|uniref:Uncharacterized protein n=1 Tax=Abeliophyllum distichum TaxID=126358 RepID=A0ABD1Q405_9LAMI
MKIFKEDGQWVAKSKGFDDESCPSTLSFEGGEEMDEDEDEPPLRPRSNRLTSSTSGFTFTEDYYNLLNGRVDSLTSTIESVQSLLHQVLASQQALHDHLSTRFPPASSTGDLVYLFFVICIYVFEKQS